MHRKSRRPPVPTQATHLNRYRLSPTALTGAAVLAAGVWFTAATMLASRVHLVMGYGSVPSGPAWLELFLASQVAWIAAATTSGVWLAAVLGRMRIRTDKTLSPPWVIIAWGTAGGVPLVINGLRISGIEIAPNYWEVLWIAAGSGVSCGLLAQQWPEERGATAVSSGNSLWALVGAAGLFAAWWYWQSQDYYARYLLGFNDFAHFAQRVVNTAEGRGMLLESPVLPPFWDHFNPGLLALVPLWKIFPSVHLFFILQAVALASGAVLIWGLARQLEYDRASAFGFGLAWLAQPVLGQMNLAYTYGWHPISLAIPLLLAALWCLLAQHPVWAAGLAVAAMSLEEGVIVVVALFCAGCAAQCLLDPAPAAPSSSHGHGRRLMGFSAFQWSIAAAVTSLIFLVVYRYSGIAEFQTGRFVALGNSAVEVLLSPVRRPAAFWGAIFRWDKLAFVLSLWLPCFLPALLRGWRWLAPTLLPLLVLIVWDHRPATSLAFQYSSTLLPLFWLAALIGGRAVPRLSAVGAGVTGLVLSFYVGQLPYSSPTLLDVIGHTYQVDTAEEVALARRQPQAADGQWLSQQVARVRTDGGEVLATGRVAAHLVGNRDVETVGQYRERRERLAELPDRVGNPLGHYRWIVLDRREAFQQTPADTAAVEREALEAGFRIVSDRYDIVVMEPAAPQP